MKKFFSVLAAAALCFVTAAYAQNPGNVANHAFAIGKGPTIAGYTSLLCGAGQLAVAQAGADPICRTVSGDWTLNAAGVATLATVNANVGAFGSATQCTVFTVNAKGLITAASQTTCTPSVASLTGLGTGVAAALANNIGSAGAVVVFNGAGGTPSSLVLTNATGLPVAGITGLGANCSTFLGTPSSANLRACLTDETGSGLAYFQGGDIGTPSAGVGTNLTALNATNLGSGTVPAARMPALTGDCTSTIGTVALTCTSINGVNLNTAWTTYTPTVSAQTGTITTSTATGRYKVIGKTVVVEAAVVITTAGTGAGWLGASLPFTAASNVYVGSAMDFVATARSGGALIANAPFGGFGVMVARDAVGTTFIASGTSVAFGMVYEVP